MGETLKQSPQGKRLAMRKAKKRGRPEEILVSTKERPRDGRGKNPNSRANLDRGRKIANSRPRRRTPEQVSAEKVAMFCHMLMVGGTETKGLSPSAAAVEAGLPAAAGPYLVGQPEVQEYLSNLDVDALREIIKRYPQGNRLAPPEWVIRRTADLVNKALERNDFHAALKGLRLLAVLNGQANDEGFTVVQHNTQNNVAILPNGAEPLELPDFATLDVLKQRLIDALKNGQHQKDS
jgi:hypothetical protein